MKCKRVQILIAAFFAAGALVFAPAVCSFAAENEGIVSSNQEEGDDAENKPGSVLTDENGIVSGSGEDSIVKPCVEEPIPPVLNNMPY